MLLLAIRLLGLLVQIKEMASMPDLGSVRLLLDSYHPRFSVTDFYTLIFHRVFTRFSSLRRSLVQFYIGETIMMAFFLGYSLSLASPAAATPSILRHWRGVVYQSHQTLAFLVLPAVSGAVTYYPIAITILQDHVFCYRFTVRNKKLFIPIEYW
jgi:hypothetical protein